MGFEDKVIILKKIKYSESDLVLQTINRQGNQLSFLARSALKSKKRFGGGILEPTHYLSVSYTASKTDSDLHTLQEATLIDDFKGIRLNYEKLQLALYFLKLVSKITLEGEMHNHNIFNLLGHALKMLEQDVPLAQLKTLFEVKYLHYQGVLPPNDEFSALLKTPLGKHDFTKPLEDVQNLQRKIATELQDYLSFPL